MLIALALVELGLPYLSACARCRSRLRLFRRAAVSFPGSSRWSLVVGAVGGLYPAFFLSRFQPAHVLKANKSSAETRGTGRLRTLLVVAQFAVSIGLIICTCGRSIRRPSIVADRRSRLRARRPDPGATAPGASRRRAITRPRGAASPRSPASPRSAAPISASPPTNKTIHGGQRARRAPRAQHRLLRASTPSSSRRWACACSPAGCSATASPLTCSSGRCRKARRCRRRRRPGRSAGSTSSSTGARAPLARLPRSGSARSAGRSRVGVDGGDNGARRRSSASSRTPASAPPATRSSR